MALDASLEADLAQTRTYGATTLRNAWDVIRRSILSKRARVRNAETTAVVPTRLGSNESSVRTIQIERSEFQWKPGCKVRILLSSPTYEASTRTSVNLRKSWSNVATEVFSAADVAAITQSTKWIFVL